MIEARLATPGHLEHDPLKHPRSTMARWPRRTWTTIFSYALIFAAFPLLCLLAWWWVRHGF